MKLVNRSQHRYTEMLIGCLTTSFLISGFLLFGQHEIYPLLWPQFAKPAFNLFADAPALSSASSWLYRWHTQLFLSRIGTVIAAFSGIGIVLVSVSGMSRWTGWKRLELGFLVRRHASARILNFDIHNCLGFFAFFFLMMTGISGSLLCLNQLCLTFNIGDTSALYYSTLIENIKYVHSGYCQNSVISLFFYLLFCVLSCGAVLTGIRVGFRKKDKKLIQRLIPLIAGYVRSILNSLSLSLKRQA